jgi:hypothetical protein
MLPSSNPYSPEIRYRKSQIIGDFLSTETVESERIKPPNDLMICGIIQSTTDDNKFKKDDKKGESTTSNEHKVDKALKGAAIGTALLDWTKTEIDITIDLGATSKILSTTSEILGPISNIGVAVNTVSDIRELQSGKISAARFSYNTTGTAVGLAVTAFTADPILGALAGGVFVAGQQIYDGISMVADKTRDFLYDFENSIGKTWIPGQ